METFIPAYPLSSLRGAEYNPRRIDQAAESQLRESLARLGVAKPVIISQGTILAGHQRIQQLRAMAITHVPVVSIKSVAIADEIRFNQVHNGTDLDSGDERINLVPATVGPRKYELSTVLQANPRASLAAIRPQICELLAKYGNWGACVATMSGKVVHAAQYAVCCKTMDIPARVYRIADEDEKIAREMLCRQYGVFSYEHLERKTYIQTIAQTYRLRKGSSDTQNSALYEERVLPRLKRSERLLDFGCGQADYVRMLQRQNHQALGVEFFFRRGKLLDGAAVHEMIEAVCESLRSHGLFDVVVVDSVLNSVDSIQAEADVLACAQALCRMGGRIYFSGRSRTYVEMALKRTRSGDYRRRIEFLDEHGFSALYRGGNWFYQKFHSQDQVRAMARAYIGPEATFGRNGGADRWRVEGVRTTTVGVKIHEAALRREFDLLWPGGRSVGRADQIVEAWRKAR